MIEREIIETKNIEMCGKKVVIEMRKVKAGSVFYLRPFAKLDESERQSYQYWRQAYLEIQRELEESKKRENALKQELLSILEQKNELNEEPKKADLQEKK